MDFSQIKNFISNLNLNQESIDMIAGIAKPLLQNFLNIDGDSIDTLSQLIPKFLKGDIDLNKLLAVALPFVLTYFSTSVEPQKKSTEQNNSVDNYENEELNEQLKNISPEAFSQLSLFLQNDNAS